MKTLVVLDEKLIAYLLELVVQDKGKYPMLVAEERRAEAETQLGLALAILEQARLDQSKPKT